MECGHKFNYAPLFNDIFTHKYCLNILEGHGKLRVNEIRCPYCRFISKNLLPFYDNYYISPDVKLRKIIGINQSLDDDEGGMYLLSNKIIREEFKLKTREEKIKKSSFLKRRKLKAKEDAKKIKEEAKAAKLKEKEEAKAAKLKEKEETKAAKLNAKKMKK